MTSTGRDPLRVMVVDADSTYRRCFAGSLGEHPAIQVVATAMNARTALPKAESYRPDVILLDMANAEVDGHGLLAELHGRQIGGRVVLMVAGDAGAELERARQYGVSDAVQRVPSPASESAVAALGRDVAQRLVGGVQPATPSSVANAAVAEAARARRELQARKPPAPVATTPPPVATASLSAEPAAQPATAAPRRGVIRRAVEVVGIGISTGGPKALATMLPGLPADFPLPIVIVQHMPASFTGPLAESLSRTCRIPVREAKAGDVVRPGVILIAPGGCHTKIVRAAEGCIVRLTDDPPEQSCRPSVDYLFRSLHQVYAGNTLAVVMTGMGEDGLQGCKLLRAAGATVFAQDEATCTVFGMPRAIVQNGLADAVIPLEHLAARITEAVRSPLRCN